MSQPTYTRFALTQRLEHAGLLVTFTLLALTGLPQKYADAPLSQFVITALGDIENVRRIHRVAAGGLMLLTIFHIAAVGYRLYVRRAAPSILPTLTDVTDAIGAFLYNLGLRRQPPQAGRYNYGEKVEYWAVVWGTVIMVITGFMLWNPIATTRWLPGQAIPAAKAAHGAEAVLAVVSILIWHMYNVHLRQFNRSMFTGQLTEHEMLEEHPRELADLKAGLAPLPPPAAERRRRQQRYLPAASVLAAVLLVGVFQFVTFEQTALDTVPPRETVQVFVPLTPTPLPATATPPPVTAVTWNAYVSTILAQKCTMCHGGAAGLELGTYAGALAGGLSGPAVAPGDPQASVLVQSQSAGGHPGQLSDDELAHLIAWIEMGAPE